MMRLVYITAPTMKEAQSLGKTLVEKHLAACVNIIPGMEAIYSWEGSIESAIEVILLVKTHEAKVDAITDLMHETHSYDVPCVLSLPIDTINQPYMNWLQNHLA